MIQSHNCSCIVKFDVRLEKKETESQRSRRSYAKEGEGVYCVSISNFFIMTVRLTNFLMVEIWCKSNDLHMVSTGLVSYI